MTLDYLEKLFELNQCRELSWKGLCHDCKKQIEVVARVEDDGRVLISGGAVYRPRETEFRIKCPDCFGKDPSLHDQNCEVYARIVGYLRPVKQFNPGKKAEFKERTLFDFHKFVEKPPLEAGAEVG